MVKEIMNTVYLQPYSWISHTLGMPEASNSILKKKVKAGTKLGAFLAEVANSYPEFQKMVFNAETSQMSEHVLVILNNKLIQYGEINELILNDQDNITLAPVLFGG
jgi:ribonucleotide reductase beta subunit family protein with ferritin-like domain